MAVEYLNIYKWENLQDGTKEKFEGKITVLGGELSLHNKLGCPDITIPVYLPLEMYDKKMEQKYNSAKVEYKLRGEKLDKLIELILNKVSYNKKINDEYLYELWISRVYELNWINESDSNDVLDQINILYEALQMDCDVNPFDIDINKQIEKEEKGIKKILNRFKKKKQ